MKSLLLLLAGCFCCSLTMAQEEQQTLPKFKPERPLVQKFPKERNVTLSPDSTLNLREFAFQNKKPGVYRLPQDNMPCIVPDPTKTVHIPNAWKGSKRIPYKSKTPSIPNPTQQWIPIPIANTDNNVK